VQHLQQQRPSGGDKGNDTFDFVAECRNLPVTPHLALNHERRGGGAKDERTTRHQGYRISQIKRKRIEECFGWRKAIALLRKVRHRGIFKVNRYSASLVRPTIWCACGTQAEPRSSPPNSRPTWRGREPMTYDPARRGLASQETPELK
jgi:hypothetical protein